MEYDHFKLNNTKEVNLFSERLDNYQRTKLGHRLSYIDLNKAYTSLQNLPQGGRLFTALLDLKLNFVMLYIDSSFASGTWNKYFSKGKLEGGSVLDNQQKFNGKADIQYYYGNFIPRYRAIWDKIMGILILSYAPEKYDKYRKAKSRKKEFENICKTISQISDNFVQGISKGISDFDNSFRTPEVHGTGTIRKWSFTMISKSETPLIEFHGYWNWLLPILKEIDNMIKEIKN